MIMHVFTQAYPIVVLVLGIFAAFAMVAFGTGVSIEMVWRKDWEVGDKLPALFVFLLCIVLALGALAATKYLVGV